MTSVAALDAAMPDGRPLYAHVMMACVDGQLARLRELLASLDHLAAPHLRRLVLHHNRLCSLDGALSAVPRLLYLDVSSNSLLTLRGVEARPLPHRPFRFLAHTPSL